MAQTLRSITVRELIDLLKDEDEGALVIFSCDYGDHSHTEQALGLRGECEEVTITKSAYSHSGFAVAESDDEDEDTTDDAYPVLR